MNKCSVCGREGIKENYVCARCNNSSGYVTAGKWFLNSLAFLIPIYGWFVRIFVLAGSKKADLSIRNWARAQLILILISAVISILGIILFRPYFADWVSNFSSMLGEYI